MGLSSSWDGTLKTLSLEDLKGQIDCTEARGPSGIPVLSNLVLKFNFPLMEKVSHNLVDFLQSHEW